MEPLDGNAIAGQLYEHFGQEMTSARGRCGHCGARGQVAELRVYTRAPGAVARCQHCGGVLMLLVTIQGQARIHFDRYELLDQRPPTPGG